jgi:hypothetical protein
MAAHTGNQCKSRRPICGNTRHIASTASIRTFDRWHDRNWSYNPDLDTRRIARESARKAKP